MSDDECNTPRALLKNRESHLDRTDQVATVPGTDPIQVRFLFWGEESLRRLASNAVAAPAQ